MLSPGDVPLDRSATISDAQVRLLQTFDPITNCLEIGSYIGFSTIFLAEISGRVVSVDPHTVNVDGIRVETLNQFIDNIYNYGFRRVVVPMVGLAENVLPLLRPDQFDFIFIDGNHSKPWVLKDCYLSYPLLRRGGYMAFHDYEHPGTGVKEAVDEFVPGRLTKIDQEGTLVVYQNE